MILCADYISTRMGTRVKREGWKSVRDWQDVFRDPGIRTADFARSGRDPRFESTLCYKYAVRFSIMLLITNITHFHDNI